MVSLVRNPVTVPETPTRVPRNPKLYPHQAKQNFPGHITALSFLQPPSSQNQLGVCENNPDETHSRVSALLSEVENQFLMVARLWFFLLDFLLSSFLAADFGGLEDDRLRVCNSYWVSDPISGKHDWNAGVEWGRLWWVVYLAAAAALPASAVWEVDRVTGYVSKTKAQFDLRCGTLAFSGMIEGEGDQFKSLFSVFPPVTSTTV